jgi:hypothetical protein
MTKGRRGANRPGDPLDGPADLLNHLSQVEQTRCQLGISGGKIPEIWCSLKTMSRVALPGPAAVHHP